MGKRSKNVLEKIKKLEIKPIPKWQFMLKDSFVKVLFGINIFLGSIGFGIVLYLLFNSEVLQDKTLHTTLWERIVLGIPYAWILLTIFFVFVAYYNFKNTQEGYRYDVVKVLLLSLLVSLFLGYVLYITRLSERLNDLFVENIPYYTHTLDMREKIWMRPEEGYLAGKIVEVDVKKKMLEITDLDGNSWSIYYENSLVKSRVKLEKDEEVKMIGKALSKSVFEASEIRPWGGLGRRMQESR